MKRGLSQQLFGWALDKGSDDDLAVIGAVRLFKGLGKNLLRTLLIGLFEKEYALGETIFSEGDRAKALYIVMSGSVKIVKKSATGDKLLARLTQGSYFGELALISESPRFATAITEDNTRLLIMYKSYFEDLIKGNSRISSRVLLNIAESLSQYIHGGDT